MPRATRFRLHLPVRYRADDRQWHRATTENISRSGLLLRSGKTVSTDIPIELVVELPSVDSSELPAQVVCHGHVVRSLPSEVDRSVTLVAATITDYWLRRSDGS